jgi:DNA-binding NarL/FixJ family response regulator
MAIVVAVAGAGDIVAGGLWKILEQAPDLDVQYKFPGSGVHPDVVVYDAVAMADDDGAELFSLLDAADAPVVIVGRQLRPTLAAQAMARGAAAQVSLESPAAYVVDTVRAVATGCEATVREAARAEGPESELTRREVEVLRLVTLGRSNTEIAAELNLSGNTVKSIIRNAYRKIGAVTRAQAVAWCMEHGYDGWREEAREEAL